MLQEIRTDIQALLSHIVFLEICISFHLLPKGLEAKKNYCVGGVTSKDFKKKWDGNLRDMESKCPDLLLEKHCKKLFLFDELFLGSNC